MSGPCRILDWDTAFFGRRIARLEPLAPRPEQFDEATTWCGRESVDCLYFLCEAEDTESSRLAEERGFHLVDIRVEMEKSFSNGERAPNPSRPKAGMVRAFRSGDLAALQTGARENHVLTRFFRDPGFSRERAGDLYAAWLEKIGTDPEAAIFTAEAEGRPVGYLACAMESEAGRIALAGINAEQRGLGLGTALVLQALAWFLERGAKRASVVTQGANIPAQRLYASHGFYISRAQLWYHKWLR